MAHITANRVTELSASVGTGPFTLMQLTAYRRFGDRMQIGDTCWYLAKAIDAATGDPIAFEYGVATYVSANRLARTVVMDSSAGPGVPFPFGAGNKRVSMTILAPDSLTAAQWLKALGLSTGVVPVDPEVPDYSLSVAAVNASTSNMRTKTAQLAS